MRKIVFFSSISIDGFMAGPNGDLSWHVVDEELLRHFNDLFRGVSAFLEGRVTYELMTDYWPTADQNPAATPETLEFAKIWRDMPKVVYSRTLQRVEPKATIAREVVASEVNRLKEQPGGDMVVGGADLGNEFLRQDLVDEIRLYVHPAIVGQGKALFERADQLKKLRLLETRRFTSGVVLLLYGRLQ